MGAAGQCRRSADFSARSDSQNIERFEGSVAASEFEHCCGLETPRTEHGGSIEMRVSRIGTAAS